MIKSTDTIQMYMDLYKANQFRLNNELEEAIAIYERCLDRFDTHIGLLIVAAHTSFEYSVMNVSGTEEHSDKAIYWLKKALEIEPDNASLYIQLADIYALGTLNYALAAEAYRHALQIDPCNISAYWGAASLYGVPEKVVTLDEATSWMIRVVELKPDDPHSYMRLGDLYEKADRMEDARQTWLKSFFCSQPLETRFVQSVKVHFRDKI